MSQTGNSLETDDYDNNAIFFGVIYGATAVAVILDWKEFEPLRPKIVTWFTRYQSIPVQWQLQQNESCS